MTTPQSLPSAYLLELGTTPELSWAELESFYGDDVERLDDRLAILQNPTKPAKDVINSLGGTVKIFEIIHKLPLETTNEQLEEHLLKILDDKEKIKFFVAEINRQTIPSLELSDLKDKLVELGHKVRYEKGNRSGLTAALLLHKSNIIELAVINTAREIYIGKTLAVQNIDDWSYRDRGKPFAQHRRGMLTPKVARMMLNLAGPEQDKLLYDPFCGTGTVLLEAALAGYSLMGSDLDEEAVKGTRDNLEWLATNYQLQPKSRLFQADATGVNPKPVPEVIVTEPFLGKLTPKPNQIPNITKGLVKLYTGTLKNWASWLKPGSKIIMVFPRFTASNSPSVWDRLIDKLGELGYTTTLEPVIYARPGAVVQRQIVRLEIK